MSKNTEKLQFLIAVFLFTVYSKFMCKLSVFYSKKTTIRTVENTEMEVYNREK